MRFQKPFYLYASLLILFFACKKDSNSIDTTPNFYFINGGSSAFNDNLVLFNSADTITFNIIISSTYLASKTVTVSLAAADTARTSYNAANGTTYAAMPAGAFSFQQTVTTNDTTVYDTIPVKFNKQLLGADNYMLPITIASVSDYKLDTFSRVIYLHTTGSILAGIYNSTGFKTFYAGDASGNNITDTASFALTKTSVPESSTKTLVDYADLGANGWQYELSFEDGVLDVQPNDVIKNSVQANSFTIISSSFNTATKEIYIKSSYKNLSGDERIIEESLTLQ